MSRLSRPLLLLWILVFRDVVQVMDSNEPLDTASSSGVFRDVVQVMDSNEPLDTASSSAVFRDVMQVMDSNEPLVIGPDSPVYSPDASHDDDGEAQALQPDIASSSSTCGSSGRRIHPYAAEIRSMWSWRKIYSRLGTHSQCVQFAEERGLVRRELQCSYHKRPMHLEAEHGQLGRFRCCKSNCRTKSVNRAVGTWFENVRLSLTLVFQVMYAFSQGLSYEQTQKEVSEGEDDETVLSAKTVADWYSYCRETIVVYELENQDPTMKIGGPGKIVQIDESKFGRRKYNRGRHIEGHWVIGMIEDGSDDLRLEVCPDNDRSGEILVPLIRKHVQEGSIIHTDYWRAYLSLPDHGYVHKRVNHSDPVNKFVAPDGTHTQRIESQWRGLKKAFRQEHNKKDFTDWLIEYSWRRKIRVNHLDAYEELLKAIAYVYKVR